MGSDLENLSKKWGSSIFLKLLKIISIGILKQKKEP